MVPKISPHLASLRFASNEKSPPGSGSAKQNLLDIKNTASGEESKNLSSTGNINQMTSSNGNINTVNSSHSNINPIGKLKSAENLLSVNSEVVNGNLRNISQNTGSVNTLRKRNPRRVSFNNEEVVDDLIYKPELDSPAK